MNLARTLAQAMVDAYVKQYRAGDTLALLQAVQFSLGNGATLPHDISSAFGSAINAYHCGEAKTLDEAFNVHRPKYWRQQSQKDAEKAPNLFSRVNRLVTK